MLQRGAPGARDVRVLGERGNAEKGCQAVITDTTTQKPKERSGDLGRGSEVQESQKGIHEGG